MIHTILIADSGGTQTDWCFVDKEKHIFIFDIRTLFYLIEKSGYKNYQHFVPKKNKTKAYQATGEIFFLSKSDTLEAVLK